MTKEEMKAIADKHGFEILRNPITSEAWGLRLETAEDIPELDSINADIWTRGNVAVSKEYGSHYEVNGTHVYTVACPDNWFDLWGWKD